MATTKEIVDASMKPLGLEVEWEPKYGLTKREYFASMAMQGMITCPDYEGCKLTVSKLAVEYADALIEELNK